MRVVILLVDYLQGKHVDNSADHVTLVSGLMRQPVTGRADDSLDAMVMLPLRELNNVSFEGMMDQMIVIYDKTSCQPVYFTITYCFPRSNAEYEWK